MVGSADFKASTAVVVRAASAAAAPIVIDSPHSGNSHPDDLAFAAPFELARRGEDPLVERRHASSACSAHSMR